MACFSVRLLVLSRLSGATYFTPNGGDMRFYSDWAIQILRGHWTDGKAFYGLPGYAFLLAGLNWIPSLYVSDPADYLYVFSWVSGLFQAGSEALVAVIIYKIALLVFDESGTGHPGLLFDSDADDLADSGILELCLVDSENPDILLLESVALDGNGHRCCGHDGRNDPFSGAAGSGGRLPVG